MFAHGRYESDASGAPSAAYSTTDEGCVLLHPPPLGRVVESIPDPFQGRTLEGHLVQHVLVAHESRRVPPVVVERHPLDEAYVHIAAESLIGHSNEVGQFVVVYPSHDHAIDLDPRTAGSVWSDPRMSARARQGSDAATAPPPSL